MFEKCAKNVLDRCYGLKISPVKTLVHCDHWDLVTTRFTVRYYMLFSTHPLNNTVPPAMVVSGGQQRSFIFLIWSTHCRLLHFGNQQHQGRCRQKGRNEQEGPCTECHCVDQNDRPFFSTHPPTSNLNQFNAFKGPLIV